MLYNYFYNKKMRYRDIYLGLISIILYFTACYCANNFNLPWPTNVESNATLWVTDRHAPAAFINDVFAGRNPVILNEVNSTSFTGISFQDLQGKKINGTFQLPVNLTIPAGVCGSLYIPLAWQANPGPTFYRRPYIWLRMVNSSNPGPCVGDGCALYFTIGFSNQNVVGSLLYFDPNVGNVILPNPGGNSIYYNDYNQACAFFTGGTLQYYWNGAMIIELFNLTASTGDMPNMLTEVFLQQRNTNITTKSYWSEVSTGYAVENDGFLRTSWIAGTVIGDIMIMKNATLLLEGAIVSGFIHNWGNINMTLPSNPFHASVIENGYRAFTNQSNIPKIFFNTQLNDSFSLSDILVIDGPIEGGTTTVYINNINGTGAATEDFGIFLIQGSLANVTFNCSSFELASPGYIELNGFFYFLVCNASNGPFWYLKTNTTSPSPPSPSPSPSPPTPSPGPSSPISPPSPSPPISPGAIIAIVLASSAVLIIILTMILIGTNRRSKKSRTYNPIDVRRDL